MIFLLFPPQTKDKLNTPEHSAVTASIDVFLWMSDAAQYDMKLLLYSTSCRSPIWLCRFVSTRQTDVPQYGVSLLLSIVAV